VLVLLAACHRTTGTLSDDLQQRFEREGSCGAPSICRSARPTTSARAMPAGRRLSPRRSSSPRRASSSTGATHSGSRSPRGPSASRSQPRPRPEPPRRRRSLRSSGRSAHPTTPTGGRHHAVIKGTAGAKRREQRP
jgi:hypothetical protein